MIVSVSIDDTGAQCEDDEPFDPQRLATILRVLGAEVMNVYEAGLHLEGTPNELP